MKSEKNTKIYIYRIFFPTSKRSNPYYVGVAGNLRTRMSGHLGSKSLVGNTLNKYNDWIIKKLHACKTYEEAFGLEIEEIRKHNCIAPNGYNLTAGGEGTEGYCHTEKTKANMRKSQKIAQNRPDVKERYSKRIQGNQYAKGCHYKRSKEWKEEKSKAMQGNQNGKGHGFPKGNQYSKGVNIDGSNKNGSDRIEAQIKNLKTRIAKLEN